MKVLVTFGSTRGGTKELATMVADGLREEGFDVDVQPPRRVSSLADDDAVVVGGALYAARWHRAARRFVRRHTRELSERPTYFFSSGPLDDSATQNDIPPVKGVASLMERVGARGHVTFGGRLAPDAKGPLARAIAKKSAGDWRDPTHVRSWTHSVATQLRNEVGSGV